MKLYNIKHKALSLMEILIVLILIGIVAGFAVPNYLGARERAEDREARAMLVLIRAAQEVRRLETGLYLQCGVNCNNAQNQAPPGLGLDLPQGITWTYSVPNTTAGTDFCAQATGAGSNPWSIREDQREAVINGCP
tara:strand:- start:156 stop:563 length:408 start_codon:yes stop_codon:yes gene_type:complete